MVFSSTSSPARMRFAWLILIPASVISGCGGDGGDLVGPTTGTLTVATRTTGETPGAGYTVSLDGRADEPIGVSDEIQFSELTPGSHVVALGGLPAGCTLDGVNPRPVTVTAGATASILFEIDCVPPVGSIQVSTETAGPGPESYSLLLDGTSQGTIAGTGTLPLTSIPAGTHTLGLSGIPANCQVQGENPRPVTVQIGGTAASSFAIECTAPPAETGSISISTTTTGVDPDGFQVQLDGGAAQPIGVNGTLVLANTGTGSHTVQLAGLETGCSVAGTNPRTVTVSAGATASVAFTVTCAPPPPTAGSISITTATSGPSPDADGYTFALDNGLPQPIGSNATVTLPGVPSGSHSIQLSGAAPNCTVAGDNPRTVAVVAGETTSVTFAVTCAAPTSPIVLTSNGPGLLALFLVNPDGTELRALTGGFGGVWSPDGRKILFSQSEDLYVINADGSGRTALVSGGRGSGRWRWSPDGTMIAYTEFQIIGDDIYEDLWVMRSDGTGKLRLAETATSPSWAPTGRRLVYSDQRSPTDVHLRIINVDGSEDARLTGPGISAFQPAWSPQDARIAFVTIGEKELFLIRPDGSGLVNLTQGQAQDDGPTWSPDGSKIVFTTAPLDQPLRSDIAVINSDGTGRTVITNRPGFSISPNWSPDGRQIVFAGDESGNSEIFIMNADGTGIRNLTNRPETRESDPSWAGGSSGSNVRGSASTQQLRSKRLSP